jgi:monoamine oxidase
MRIGVVGLGLAGLRTAMLIERAGAEALMFEAREQAGGRLRAAPENGAPLYEAGGEWIDADHHRMLSLLKEFGLTARPASDEPGRIAWRGRLMSESEVSAGSLAEVTAVESLARDLCRELRAPIWDNPQAAEFDRRTLASFIRANARSEQARFLLTAKYRGDEGDDLDRIGLLGWLAGFQLYAGREGGEMCAYRLPTSSRELRSRMLSTLNAAPAFGRALRGVKQERGGVTLFFSDSAVKVDRVVLTLPPRCLERIWFDPPLRPEQFRAIRACRMGRAVKIVWEFDRPWWRDEGWNGGLLSDGPLQSVWEASIGEAPILCAFVCGRDAIGWRRMGDPVRAGLESFSLLCPAAGRSFARGWFHDWISDPFAQGVYSHMQPGYALNYLRFIAGPFDRVHFAGEHTATWSGFMEGALESAERVAREMIEGRPLVGRYICLNHKPDQR